MLVGPCRREDLPWKHLSTIPLQSVVKDPIEMTRRVCADPTFVLPGLPKGFGSLNDGIPKNSYMGKPYKYQLPRFTDFVTDAVEVGLYQVLGFKIDWKFAFRQNPLDPADWWLTVYHIQEADYFIDIHTNFGYRSAGIPQQIESESISFMLNKISLSSSNFKWFMRTFFDDEIVLAHPAIAEELYQYSIFLHKILGIRTSTSMISPTRVLLALGVVMDFDLAVLYMPAGKEAKLKLNINFEPDREDLYWQASIETENRPVQTENLFPDHELPMTFDTFDGPPKFTREYLAQDLPEAPPSLQPFYTTHEAVELSNQVVASGKSNAAGLNIEVKSATLFDVEIVLAHLSIAEEPYQNSIFLHKILGIGTSTSKDHMISSTRVLLALGVVMDFDLLVLYIPAGKEAKLKLTLEELKSKEVWTRKDLQQCLGLLNQWTEIICAGRVSLNRWWYLVASELYFSLMVVIKTIGPKQFIEMDASKSYGLGAINYISEDFFMLPTPAVIFALPIHAREMAVLMLGLDTWAGPTRTEVAHNQSDNQAVIAAVNVGGSQDNFLAMGNRYVYYQMAMRDSTLLLTYVNTKENVFADNLSRDCDLTVQFLVNKGF